MSKEVKVAYWISLWAHASADHSYIERQPQASTSKFNNPSEHPSQTHPSITMAVQPSQARSLYRRFLRELPSRTPSILANPSPMQKHIRTDIASPTPSQHKSQQRLLAEGDQYVQYLKAQRMYITLVERYNPGMNMNEEEKVRLTARRVGMNLPIEMQKGADGGGKKGD